MKVLGLTLIFVLIAIINITSIIKKTTEKVKYIVTYVFILAMSFIVSLLQVVEKSPTSPSKVIETIVKGIIGDI